MKDLSRKWQSRIVIMALCIAMVLGDTLMVSAAPQGENGDVTIVTEEPTATPTVEPTKEETAGEDDATMEGMNTSEEEDNSTFLGQSNETDSQPNQQEKVENVNVLSITRDSSHGKLNQVIRDGKKYFIYEDGTVLTGWYNLTSYWKFYLDPRDGGAAVTGYQYIDGKEYMFNGDGVVNQQSGTPIIDGKKYWTAADGSLRTGWLNLVGMRLYFDPTLKYALVGIHSVDGKNYYFNNDGVLYTEPGTPIYDGKKYWFTKDGSLGTGWLNLTTWKMYFDPTTFVATVGQREIDGKKYLFNSDGVCNAYASTGIIDGHKYWINSDGSISTGWKTLAGMQLYFFPDTWYAAVGMTNVDGKTYYFDENGVMCTGVRLVDGKLYLFSNDGTVASAGTPTVNGKKYWTAADGSIRTGWLSFAGMQLYFDPAANGAAAIGFMAIDGNTYYFDPNGMMLTGFQTIDDKRYCFRDNGIMYVNATPEINGKKYGFKADGEQIIGWFQLGNYRLYFDPNDNGAAATGEVTIGGVKYEFDSNGVLISSSNSGPISTVAGGQRTVKNLLQNAMKPVGSTLYIWGGGHDTADATRSGVNPSWSAFFNTQNSSYDYTQHRYEYGKGLDCSGFVGWAAYNAIYSSSGQSYLTQHSTGTASYLANTRGWGTYYSNPSSFKPGDVVSRSGHTWIVLGQCSDGSVVIVHATPPGGVQIGGTVTPSGSSNSQAVQLARTYMQRYYPNWYFSTGSSGRGYLTGVTVCRWNTNGNILSDPDGYQNMSAEQVLRNLFGE